MKPQSKGTRRRKGNIACLCNFLEIPFPIKKNYTFLHNFLESRQGIFLPVPGESIFLLTNAPKEFKPVLYSLEVSGVSFISANKSQPLRIYRSNFYHHLLYFLFFFFLFLTLKSGG